MLRVKKQLPSSAKEELARLFEDTDKQLESERVPGQENWKNADRQRGIALDSNDLILRVLKMNPFVWTEDSINCPGHANFYFVKNGHKECAGAPFKRGMVYEFSRIYVDASDRPIGIEYGWREILHRLLKKKLISWAKMVKHFPIYNSARSEPFDRQVQNYKN